MKDEHFMRAWNEGHDHFSADITRGLKWLAEPFRRLGEWIAVPNAPGEDNVFTRAAAHCRLYSKSRTVAEARHSVRS